MKLSEKMYRKMLLASHHIHVHAKLVKEIEEYLDKKGVNIDYIRSEDIGNFVEMIDYGNATLSKELLQDLFNKYPNEKKQ